MRLKRLTTRNVVLAILSALIALCLALGIFILPKIAAADGGNEAEPQYAHTYILGASGTETASEHYYSDIAAGWAAATEQSGKIVVRLENDWQLAAYLTVPEEKDITLDLNGHVIDRGLTSAESNGYVLKVEGKFTLTDSKPEATHLTEGGIPIYTYEEGTADDNKAYLTKTVQTALKGGIITGGYSFDTVGGVWVAGDFTLNGGTIYGNTTENQYGGGVYVEQYSSFTMNGGAIIHNEVKYGKADLPAMGGGVVIYGAGAKYTLNGGLIADNVSRNTSSTGSGIAIGGGVIIYGTEVNPAEFTMTDGMINNNRTVSNNYGVLSVGGAICLQYCVAEISGGEISDNRTLELYRGVEGAYSPNNLGSAIGNYSYNQVVQGAGTKALTFSGGLITRNLSAYGTISMYGNQFYTGGQLVNNIATLEFAGLCYNNRSDSVLTISDTFEYYDNYTVKTLNNSYEKLYDSSYETRYHPLMPGNPAENSHDFNVGKLSENLKRYIMVYDDVLDRDVGLSQGYTEYNSAVYEINGVEYRIPVNPNKYFQSSRPNKETETPFSSSMGINLNGDTGKIILNSEGEVAVASLDKEIVFTITYIDGATGEEKTESFDYDTCDYYGIVLSYGDEVTSIKFNGEELDVREIDGARMYKFVASVGDEDMASTEGYFAGITELKTIFCVVVQPRTITADDEKFVAEFGDVSYTGSELKPVPATVTYKAVELQEDVDYTLSYSNNLNAGDKAQAVFTFKGNYSGSVTKNFTITASTDLTYNLTWEYSNGGNWEATDNLKFVYDGSDQSGKIRAVLTLTENDDIYVYAENVTAQNTSNMYLQFSGDGLVNADEYTVTVAGYGNYSLPENSSATVTITPKSIKFDPSGFNYIDDDDTRLWQLTFDGGTSSELRDSVTYIVGDEAVTGDMTDAYARFRNKQLTIALNPNYVYNGQPLSAYIETMATVTYENEKATGVATEVTEVNTSVTFVFNANYAVDGAENNTVTLNKTWYIVTINNGLLNSDGTGDATLPAFTYGVPTDAQPFKPEHGDTVFFTFRKGTEVVSRVAVTYSGNEKTFRLFGINDKDEYVFGDVMPDTNYFATVINELGAGNYQLDVHVNEYTDSEGVVYYAIDRTFNFTVKAYDIGEEDGLISATVTTPELVYTGSAVVPEVEIAFNGTKLVYGIDYTVTASAVNAGAAVAQVSGIGNFGGTLEVSFTIAKAENNEWESAPNIIRWVYGGFNPSVNTVTSSPKFMSAQESVAYTVLDSDMQPLNATLTNFHTEGNGVVSAIVAAELGKLYSGTYYLVSKLTGTDNYNGLDTTNSPLEFNVIKADNAWSAVPSIIQWNYKEFDKEVNRIFAVSKFLDGEDILYSITTDEDGNDFYEGLEEFTAENGVVSDTIEDLLKGLPVGTYYLFANLGGGVNYNGLSAKVEFSVAKAVNDWKTPFDVISWTYNGYDENVNLILGAAEHGVVEFTVSKDGTAVEGLESFTEVNATIAGLLGGLPAGEYTVTARVVTDDNYTSVADGTVTLTIAKAGHVWEEMPEIMAWVQGEYDENENSIVLKDIFGNTAISENVDILIYDSNLDENDITDENVIYKAVGGEVIINKLAEAGVGHYTLKATVKETVNYFGAEKTFNFQIFAPEGLAWWAWLLIIIGILGVIALVFFILHEKGVLQMLTGRFVIAMRTKMSVDATIAAVRANKRAEAAKISIAEAEARDRREAFNSASPEERTAMLRQKAEQAQMLVEKIQDKMVQVQEQDLKAKNKESVENIVDEDSNKEDKG